MLALWFIDLISQNYRFPSESPQSATQAPSLAHRAGLTSPSRPPLAYLCSVLPNVSCPQIRERFFSCLAKYDAHAQWRAILAAITSNVVLLGWKATWVSFSKRMAD